MFNNYKNNLDGGSVTASTPSTTETSNNKPSSTKEIFKRFSVINASNNFIQGAIRTVLDPDIIIKPDNNFELSPGSLKTFEINVENCKKTAVQTGISSVVKSELNDNVFFEFNFTNNPELYKKFAKDWIVEPYKDESIYRFFAYNPESHSFGQKRYPQASYKIASDRLFVTPLSKEEKPSLDIDELTETMKNCKI